MLGDQKQIAIEFSGLKLKERNKALSILLEMSDFLSSSMKLGVLLEGALARVMEFFHLEGGRIYLLDPDEHCLNLAIHGGIEPRGLEKLHINEGFSGKAARTKSFIAQHVSELEDKERAAFLLKKGLRHIICVPLILTNKVVGVMNLATSHSLNLDRRDIDLMTTIGNQIAVAVNNARLYEDLQNKIQTLEEKRNMIQLFATSVSHDLKSPVTAIYGLAKRLMEKYGDVLDEKGNAYCEHICNAVVHMIDLVESINAYVTAKEAPLSLEKVKIEKIVDGLRREFSNLLDERHISWSQPSKLPEVIADRLSLIRVFRNLVENALKYGGEGMGRIELGYEANETHHVFSVKDDGVGIGPEDRERIFSVFHRGMTTKEIDGSGLGLAIIKEIAERHHGRAWVEFIEGDGTKFCISILHSMNSETEGGY
jgi:K+-sensing histidine kinase KdpD